MVLAPTASRSLSACALTTIASVTHPDPPADYFRRRADRHAQRPYGGTRLGERSVKFAAPAPVIGGSSLRCPAGSVAIAAGRSAD